MIHKIFSIPHAVFRRLLKERSRSFHGRYFAVAVFHLPLDVRGPAAACVISKKVAPKAVSRNHIKRRCRAGIRMHSALMDKRDAYVFYAKKTASNSTFSDIKDDVKTLLERANQ